MPENLNHLTESVIGAAIEIHRALGPGLLESVYERAMGIELSERGIPFETQVHVPIAYKGQSAGDLRLDLLVDRRLVVELKAIDALAALHQAQVLSYLRATNLTLGLLINFNVTQLVRGIKRISLNHPT
jgi:GxxExxY protein